MKHIAVVINIGAPYNPSHVSKLLNIGLPEIEEKESAEVNIGGRQFTIRRAFLNDLRKHDPVKVAKEFRRSLLIFHSPKDETVSIENAAKIYTPAHHPKSFISLNGADHLLTKAKDSHYVGKLIASWLRRYIEIDEEIPKLNTDSQVIAETSLDSFTTEIQLGVHHLISDEPIDIGGNNLGPSPYGLLSSPLAACTSMTLQIYAQRKGWNLENVRVHVTHVRDYAKDCKDCESNNTKIDQFQRKIELIGQVDQVESRRLLQIADKCPVHKTLHNKVHVHTELMD